MQNQVFPIFNVSKILDLIALLFSFLFKFYSFIRSFIIVIITLHQILSENTYQIHAFQNEFDLSNFFKNTFFKSFTK
jgi:hypothetical protein